MPDESSYLYVLFSRTGAEEKLSNQLNNELGGEGFLAFAPQKYCVFRRQGQQSSFQKTCFPGYVFIESSKSVNEFMKQKFPAVSRTKDAYRFLCYGDRYDIAMREEERVELIKLIGKDHCIDISTGFREGDSVKIISGVLVGNESRLLRINRNRKEAIITLNMFGSPIEVSVGLELIEKS